MAAYFQHRNEKYLLTMTGRRKRSQRTRSKRSSGSSRSKRSSSSNIATVVSFAVVNVDLDDPNQNMDQSKRRTKMLAESACLGASESTADKGVTSNKPDTVNVGVATDEFRRVEAYQHDVGDSAIGTHGQANAEKHLGQVRKVSFTGEEHIASSNEVRTPEPHGTGFYEVEISRGSMADSNDISTSDSRSRVNEESPASRRKKGSKAKSQPRRRSSYRRRRSKSYRSKNHRAAPRRKRKSSRKSRTRKQKGRSLKPLRSTSRKSSSRRREIPIIRKGEASQTPYYTPRSASDAAVPEGEYTPTMESMGVKSCNCDECLRYEERAQAQFKKRSSQRFPLTIRQTSRSRQDQPSPMSKCPYRSASKPRKGIHTTPRRESRKLTNRSTLQNATLSGSLHTDFNIALPSAGQPSEQYLQSGTAPKPIADRKSLTAQSLTTKNLTTSTDYNPERDYNPVCDCTNCQIHRSIREADDLCDCYDCINAMRATGSDSKTRRKQYKLKDPPTEGHKPKPPRKRGKTTYPWVKQLTKLQQPDKPYNSFKQKSVQKDFLEVKPQRLSSGKNRSVPENNTSAINRVPRNARRSKSHGSIASLARNQDEEPSTKQISQEPPSSHSSQVDQSSGSAYKTTENSETRSYSSTDRRGATSSTTGTMTSTDGPTTLTSSASTGTTYQSTTETEASVSLSEDYAYRKSLTADDKREFNKRKPWVP